MQTSTRGRTMNARVFTISIGLIIILFSASSALGQGLKKAPRMPTEIRHYADVTYHETDKGPLKLDLVAPREGDGPFPVVVIIHAIGPWAKDRGYYLPQAVDLARDGYIGVVISYRHTPDIAYPNAIEDAEAAIRWLRTHATKHKIDPNRIAALGYSGGGAIACLLAMKCPEDKVQGKPMRPSSRVQAAVAYYPPTDFTQLHKDCGNGKVPFPKGFMIATGFEIWLGGSPAKVPARFAQASPITHVSNDMSPLLLIHGMEDSVVPFDQSQMLTKAIGAAKGQVTLVALSGAEHGFDEVSSLNTQIAIESTRTFLNGHLTRSKSAIVALRR
jgi:acetyl esterase/lipase